MEMIMTQLRTAGFRYVGVEPTTGLGLHKITDKRGGEVIEITIWDGHRGQSVQLANIAIGELLADLGEMLENA
jgi:hypothetical protein